MKLSVKSAQPKISKTKRIIITVILVICVFLCLIWFTNSYNNLNKSIQNERVESMREIGTIIYERNQNLLDNYTIELERIRTVISTPEIKSISDINHLLNEPEDIFILQNNGKFINLNEEELFFMNTDRILQEMSVNEVKYDFGSILYHGDFCMFFLEIDPVVISNIQARCILKVISADEYTTLTTNMIFNEQGSTYIIDNNGEVLFNSTSKGSIEFFDGFNFISYLEGLDDVSEKEVEDFKNALITNNREQFLIEVEGISWLIQNIPSVEDQNLILTVPISITFEDTIVSMKITVIAIILVIILMIIIFLMWIVVVAHHNNMMKLEQAKSEQKSDFMNKISHDIRTPLNAIVGMIEIAKRSTDDKETLDDCLDSAKLSSEYLISIINDVLDMSRIESGKLILDKKPFDIHQLLKDIAQMNNIPATLKNIKIVLENNIEDNYLYTGDIVRIKQCLINLVSNAIKFTPNGGTIKIECSEVEIIDNTRMIKFGVLDTGIGMNKQFLSKIFEPFEQEYRDTLSSTTQTPGSGLGLAIVYHLTTLMGGTVHVESEENVGSHFTIDIPMEVTPKNQNQEVTVSSVDSLKSKRVLVAEDNEINRSIVTYFLNDLEMIVEEAENGMIALEKFSASKPGYYDLIIMDIQMPVMDGLETSKKIRISGHPDSLTIPIIALTANAFSKDASKSIAAGMQDHLAKPLDPKILRETLIKWIKNKKK